MDIFGESFGTASVIGKGSILMNKYKSMIIWGILGGYLIGPTVLSYRGLYTWSDTLFQKVTLEQVNRILGTPNFAQNIHSSLRCEYTEGVGGRSSLVCNDQTVNFNMPSYNTTLYKCFDIKLNEDGYLDTTSGNCFRGSIRNDTVIYRDKNGKEINTDYIPGRHYPLPITAHQG